MILKRQTTWYHEASTKLYGKGVQKEKGPHFQAHVPLVGWQPKKKFTSKGGGVYCNHAPPSPLDGARYHWLPCNRSLVQIQSVLKCHAIRQFTSSSLPSPAERTLKTQSPLLDYRHFSWKPVKCSNPSLCNQGGSFFKKNVFLLISLLAGTNCICACHGCLESFCIPHIVVIKAKV